MNQVINKQSYIQMYNDIQESKYRKIRIVVFKGQYTNFTARRYKKTEFEGIILNISPFHFILKVDSKEYIIRIREIKEYEFK